MLRSRAPNARRVCVAIASTLLTLGGCAGGASHVSGSPDPSAARARSLNAPPDAAGAASGLSPFVLLEPVTARTESHRSTDEAAVEISGGLLSVHNWPARAEPQWPKGLCPTYEETRPLRYCQLTSFGAFATPSTGGRNAVSWAPPKRLSAVLSNLYGGEKFAFAVAKGEPNRFARIDSSGELVTLGTVPAYFANESATEALDLGAEAAIFYFAASRMEPLVIARLPMQPPREGEPEPPALLVRLPVYPIRPDVNLAGYVPLPSDKHRPVLGAPLFVAWHDARGALDGTFLMAWRELPNGHGTRLVSAPASSEGVPKRTVITRMKADGSVVARREVDTSTKSLEALGPLHLSALDGGCLLDGKRFDEHLTRSSSTSPAREYRAVQTEPNTQVAPTPTWLSPSYQHVVVAGYDPYAAEGIVLVMDSLGTKAIRFDALGNPLGAPTEVVLPKGPDAGRPVLAGSTWVLVPEASLETLSISVLTGPHAGELLDVPLPSGRYNATAFPKDDHHLMIARFGSTEVSTAPIPEPFALAELDLDSLRSSDFEPRPVKLSIGDVEAAVAVVHGDRGSVRFVIRRTDGSIVVVRVTSEGVLAIEGEPLFGSGAMHPDVGLREVWGDEIARLDAGSPEAPQRHLTWLSSGLTLPVTDHAARIRNEPSILPGPFTAGGVLPDTAGVSIPIDEDLQETLLDCDHAVVTGPSRAVLLCVEPVLLDAPSRRAVTRVFRW